MSAALKTGSVFLASFLVGSVFAQAPKEPSNQQPPPVPQSQVTLQFPGGSVAEYVRTLESAAPGISVINTIPHADQLRLPPIKLDSVSFGPAIRLLEGEYPLDNEGVVQVFVSDLGGPLADNHPVQVYKLRGELRPSRRQPARVQVWNIGALIGQERKAEDILTAVETAVGLLEGYENAKIRYHAETNLIVASGEEEQLRAIDRVVGGVQQAHRDEDAQRSTELNQKIADWIDGLESTNTAPESLKVLFDALDKKDRTIANLREQLESREKN